MPRGPFDLIVLGHTLNELWAGHPGRIELRIGLMTRLGEELRPRGKILIIEPALMGTAQEAIRVRDGLIEPGLPRRDAVHLAAGLPGLPGRHLSRRVRLAADQPKWFGSPTRPASGGKA